MTKAAAFLLAVAACSDPGPFDDFRIHAVTLGQCGAPIVSCGGYELGRMTKVEIQEAAPGTSSVDWFDGPGIISHNGVINGPAVDVTGLAGQMIEPYTIEPNGHGYQTDITFRLGMPNGCTCRFMID